MAKYIRQPAPFNTQIVALGVDTYLKMLLTDNFVHTDLHPGNILVCGVFIPALKLLFPCPLSLCVCMSRSTEEWSLR